MNPLLDIENLHVFFSIQHQGLHAVRGVSFQVFPGESVGIVGESGSGKTSAIQAITRLIPAKVSGKALFQGVDLLTLNDSQIRKVRGKQIGYIFQDPMTSLNPTMKIGAQIIEALLYHRLTDRKDALEKTAELFDLIGLPQRILKQYPHQLSGGERQRVLIAMALICDPDLLIADEPTTALDATTTAQTLALLKKLQNHLHTTLILITHDPRIVSTICDRSLVFQAGQIIVPKPIVRTPHVPPHPPSSSPLVETRHLTKIYPPEQPAVSNVSLTIYRGEILGLIGQSGSGKSTLAKMLLRLIPPTAGQILFQGKEITHSKDRFLCRHMQMIFQDPFSSLNPRMTIGHILNEPLKIHHLPSRAGELLDLVGLPSHAKNRYPHEFSGGQRQRIGIARALALNPQFLICDEPISSLDAAIQDQILSLLLFLQKELDLTYLFIGHDLPLIRTFSTRIAVMRTGRLVEIAPAGALHDDPAPLLLTPKT